jgi:peptide/nickel transport system permease protein
MKCKKIGVLFFCIQADLRWEGLLINSQEIFFIIINGGMPMRRFAIKSFLQLLIVIISATFLAFTLSYFSPGDPAERLLTVQDTIPTEEALEKVREEMGLNDPFLIQYGRWFGNILKGDMGVSYKTNRPVTDVLLQRIPMTIRLSVVALILLLVISLPLGVLSAIYQNRFMDYLIRVLSFFGISMPTFWLGLLLIYFFVVKISWFTITNPYELKSVFLPALTLAIPLIGRYTRFIRAAALEELSQDYVTSARARGIRDNKIIFRHVLPNAMTGIITLFGMSIAALLSGAVIVEYIFIWPGVGSIALQAIEYRDYPLLQGYVVFMSVIYVTISFIVDIATQYIDPRVTMRSGSITR